MPERSRPPWSLRQRATKRAFDLLASVVGLTLCAPVAAVAWLGARMSTGEPGIYAQTRIGKGGAPFVLYKVRTMRSSDDDLTTNVTTSNDPRVTRFGRLLRAAKLDEVPQLFNVLTGDMSLVGPRPDVPGFADRLTGEARVILHVRPGITGPATLKYRDEEALLARAADPEELNRTVLFPDKVSVNLWYVQNQSLSLDLKCLVVTIVPRMGPLLLSESLLALPETFGDDA